MGGGNALSLTPPAYNALRIQTATNGMVIPVVFGKTRVTGNLVWVNDFLSIAHYKETGGKGGGGSPTVSYTYSSSFILALCEGLVNGFGQCWASKNIYSSIGDLGLTGFPGSSPQAAWGYLTSSHPDQQLNYPAIAYVCCANFDMGNNDGLPDISVEVFGLNIVPGYLDANPSDIITQMITNLRFGLVPSFPLDVSDYSTYCMANNFLLSPAFTQQKMLADHIQDILDQSNSTCIWHRPLRRYSGHGEWHDMDAERHPAL
jgi:hypothetical protein